MAAVQIHQGQTRKEKRAARRRRNQILSIFLISGGILVFFGFVVLLMHPSPNNNIGPVRIGQTMPDLTLNDLSGKQVKLSNYAGKPVLINAWATWCPPCRAEMPDLNEFYQAHQAEGFTVLAINAGEDSTTVSSFINEKGFTFPVLLDPDTVTLSNMGIDSFPTSILVGRDGVIKTIHIGMLTPESLANEITPLVR
jgi:peroxiredoxin